MLVDVVVPLFQVISPLFKIRRWNFCLRSYVMFFGNNKIKAMEAYVGVTIGCLVVVFFINHGGNYMFCNACL